MNIQISIFLSVFSLVLLGLLFIPFQDSANAQLPQCTCGNSGMSTCADGFLVSFEGQVGNTFTYSICNVDTMECNAPMALSHADILIANPDCITNPGTDITTIIIGTDGVTTRACDAPTDKDNSCGVNNLSELLIKCDSTDGIFEPTNPGDCIEIDITIENSPIMIGPSISLNKAGSDCGSGCLLGPSCINCGPPPMFPCRVITEKTLIGSVGPATFGYTADFDMGSQDFTFPLTAPGASSSFGFDLPVDESVVVTEDVFPEAWTFDNVNCVETNMDIECTTSGASFDCICMENDGTPIPTATCTFSNDPPDIPPCDIEIVKQTNPDGDPQSFAFTSNIAPINFQLVDGGTQQYMNVDVGVQLAVEEALPTNWVLESIICQGGNQSQFDIDEANQIVRITCDSANVGTTRTCTFTNMFNPLPPGEGCCVLPENGALNALRAIKDNCIVTTESLCDDQGGDFKGIGVSCETVPECQVPENIPTLGQWGLIAMAGLLGLFSLFIIIRRHRYNLS